MIVFVYKHEYMFVLYLFMQMINIGFIKGILYDTDYFKPIYENALLKE